MGIRWASSFGDTSKLGIALTTFMFHVVHALVSGRLHLGRTRPAVQPPEQGFGSPFLTFYYLGALTVGYCSGYFLLLFRQRPGGRRRLPDAGASA